MAKSSEHGIRLSCMNPAFLNSNSTSHTWPFSAVAELVDNASDPGVCAKQMWIDVVEEEGQLCLTFTDNGCGMTPNKLHKMLSFGFTEKGSSKGSQQAIGVYGNGFKSGSMRLGRDVLIFTKNGGCQTVGMMSQTYLENIKAQAVIVPIVPFNQQTKSQVVTQDSTNNLKAILEHSIITSIEKLHAHFDSIPSKKGTKILIWNIRRTKDGKPEIDFETDVTDFRLPLIQTSEIKKGQSRSGSMPHEQNIPEIQYSLRAYLSILYLKPRTQIVLRGKKNIPRLITNGLNSIEHDIYSPHFSRDKVKVTFGMSPKKGDHFGIMLYHKNRLIKAYEKVGCQLKSSGQRAGGGVIGVIECNFLKPAHNKQDFEYTKEYRLTVSALGIKLNDYWNALTDKQSRGRALQAGGRGESQAESASEKPPTWLQCEECLKWRRIPPGHYEQVPESWTCSQNPNPRYRSCSAPEEAEEVPSAPSYQKSYKKQEFKKHRKQRSLENSEKNQSEDETPSRSSSGPTQSVLQSSNSSIHTAHRKDTKEDTQQPEDASGDGWKASQAFTRSTEQSPDHPEDLSLSHTKDRTWASARANMEETMEERAIEGDKDEDVHERGTLVTREPTTDGNTRKDKLREEEKCDQRLEDEEEDDRKDTHMESEERKQNTTTSSNKRKPEPLFSDVNKKSCLQKQPAEAQNAEAVLEMSSEKAENDTSSRADDNGDTLERDVSTQRSGSSPLSGPVSPDEKDQVTNLQRLARLEKEVQKLRRLLGLQVHRTTQGTMTTEEKPKDVPANPCSREIGCQTDVTESSSSSCSLTQVSGEWAEFGQSVIVRSVGEQPEPSRTKRKTESPSWIQSSGGDSRSLQECLHLMRNNVVVLLRALLPQLDLTGISMETPDIDSILQQIIEVNQLKL